MAVVEAICDLVDELAPRAGSRRDLISFVADRPGHDARYAIDASKIERELGWTPKRDFETGLRETVRVVSRQRAVVGGDSFGGLSRRAAGTEGLRSMLIEPTLIPDVKIVTPKKHGDHRGFFSEVYNAKAWGEAGLDYAFVQDNHSYSAEAGVIRGLHFQLEPFGQTKLVRVAKGRILDVAVDLRRGSPSFGRHVAVELSAANWRQIAGSHRLRAWVLHLGARLRGALQGDQPLFARARPRPRLRRSCAGDRLGRRPGQGRCCPRRTASIRVWPNSERNSDEPPPLSRHRPERVRS